MSKLIADSASLVKSGVSPSAREAYRLIYNMTQDELTNLRAKTTALLANGAAHNSHAHAAGAEPDSPVDWLLAGIEEELRRRGVLGRSARLPVQRICAKYEDLSRVARDTLAGALQHPQPRDLAALGLLAAECLAAHLEDLGVPVGPRTMLQHAGDAPTAIDEFFPGYAACGMLGMCLGKKGG